MGGRVAARVIEPARDPVEDAVERAAIMEHDGGMSRAKAEAWAAQAHGVSVQDVRASAQHS